MRTTWLTALAAAITLPPMLVVVAEVSPAYAACTGAGNYFVGGSTPYRDDTRGVLAHIDVPDVVPTVGCGNGFTDVWDMVTPVAGNGHDYYAQIGFGVDYITTDGSVPATVTPRMISFAQYTDFNGVVHTSVYPAPALGSEHTYTELYAGGHLQMKDNGVVKSQTPFDPTLYWPSGWQGQFYNEAAYTRTSAWGSVPNNKVRFHSIQKWVNGAWTDFGGWMPGSPMTQSTNWNVETYAPTDSTLGLRTWDNR